MRGTRLELRSTRFALLLALLFLFPGRPAQSQTGPFLNRYQGSWQGEGKAFGMPARLQLRWELVLGDKFLRLSLKNTMRRANGETQVFEGHAYYQMVSENQYEAKWFDSRGVAFPIKAEAVGEALNASWGTPEQEQGRSTYRLLEPGKMEVVDAVRQKDGTWMEFGKFVLTRVGS